HLLGDLAEGPDLFVEGLALGRRREVAPVQQVPHVLEGPLLGELDRVVLAVVVEALQPADVAELGLGHDRALQPAGASTASCSTGRILARRIRSRMETMPTSAPSFTTGTCR